jgi:IclR family pca regulon transcriptional regulator
MDATELNNDKDYLKTLARGLQLIRSFGNESPRMTLSEVARKNSMSRASARRFLLTLQKLGYIVKTDEYFQLTAKILEIGHRYLANLDFIDVITPLMREVSRKLYKACSASILNETDIVYIARIPSQHQILSVNLNIGSRLPAYCTSMGRVLLGNLSEEELKEYFRKANLVPRTPRTVTDPEELRRIIRQVKSDGYCLVNQELEESLCSISVPVRNRKGNILCAINVGMPVGQVSRKEILSDYLPALKEAAAKAEQLLAHQQL